MNDPRQPVWYFEHKRRWPLDIVVAGAALFLVWSVATGRGARLAQAEIPRQQACLAVMQPQAVPVTHNAAPLWQAAVAAIVPWRDLPELPDAEERSHADQDPDDLTREDLFLPATYAPASPLCRWVEANVRARDLAGQAAALDACDWGSDWRAGMSMSGEDPYLKSRIVGRLLARHALVAAARQRWDMVETDVRSLLALARHQSAAPGILASIVSVSSVRMAQDTIRDACCVPGARPDTEILVRFADIAVERAAQALDLQPFLRFEEHASLLIMARMGAGDLSWLADVEDGVVGPWKGMPLPAVMNPYAVIYPIDRDYLIATYARWRQTPDGLDLDHHLMTGYTPTRVRLLTQMLFPALMSVQRLANEMPMRWRLMRVMVSLVRWSQAHAGRWPQQLEELGLPADALADPWAPDRPLRLRLQSDGSLEFWSVGRNGRDETAIDEAERAWYRRTPDDIVFRLPGREVAP